MTALLKEDESSIRLVRSEHGSLSILSTGTPGVDTYSQWHREEVIMRGMRPVNRPGDHSLQGIASKYRAKQGDQPINTSKSQSRDHSETAHIECPSHGTEDARMTRAR